MAARRDIGSACPGGVRSDRRRHPPGSVHRREMAPCRAVSHRNVVGWTEVSEERLCVVTVIDELHDVEGRISGRLAELEPLIEEYRVLQIVAAQLGIDLSRPRAAKPSLSVAPKRKGKPKSKVKAAAKPKTAAKKLAADTRSAPEPPHQNTMAPSAAPAAPLSTATPKATAKKRSPAKAKPASKRRAPKQATGAAARRQSGGTRRAGAERREAMLTLIRDTPGITVAEISKALGVDATSLYRAVNWLISDGAITKNGPNLRATAAD